MYLSISIRSDLASTNFCFLGGIICVHEKSFTIIVKSRNVLLLFFFIQIKTFQKLKREEKCFLSFHTFISFSLAGAPRTHEWISVMTHLTSGE